MYNVIWSDVAIRQLEVLLRIGNLKNRKGITAAIQQIDTMLRENPDQVGESRIPGKRIVFAPPLACYFRVNARLHTVCVDHIWPIVWYW